MDRYGIIIIILVAVVICLVAGCFVLSRPAPVQSSNLSASISNTNSNVEQICVEDYPSTQPDYSSHKQDKLDEYYADSLDENGVIVGGVNNGYTVDEVRQMRAERDAWLEPYRRGEMT